VPVVVEEVGDETHSKHPEGVVVLAEGSGHDSVLGSDHLHGQDVGHEEHAGSRHSDDHPGTDERPIFCRKREQF
jgi:hypothetical protein